MISMDVSAQYQRFSSEGVAAHDVRIVTKAKLQAFSICDGSCLAAVFFGFNPTLDDLLQLRCFGI
jgi:hypothetical protein